MTQETVFFDKNGVKVTDAVLVVPSGDSYPIRNISSVAVRQSNPVVKLIIGALLTFLALKSIDAGDEVYPYIFGLPGVILLWLWWNNYFWALFVGTSGGTQAAIKFKKQEPLLKEAEQAINKAILAVQGK